MSWAIICACQCLLGLNILSVLLYFLAQNVPGSPWTSLTRGLALGGSVAACVPSQDSVDVLTHG